MKKSLIYIFVLVALVLAACQPVPAVVPTEPAPDTSGEGGQEPAATAEGGMSDLCGDTSKLSDQLLFYTWVEYIDPDIKDQFEADCGVVGHKHSGDMGIFCRK